MPLAEDESAYITSSRISSCDAGMTTCSPEPDGDSPVTDGHNASSAKEQPAKRNAAAEKRINPLKGANTRNNPLSIPANRQILSFDLVAAHRIWRAQRGES